DVLVEPLPYRNADRWLGEAGPVHMPADRKEPRAALLRRSQPREALRAPSQNERDAGQRFHVVDDGGTLEQVGDCGKGGFEPGKCLSPLSRGEEGCFLTAEAGTVVGGEREPQA